MDGVVAFLNDGFSNFENISYVHGFDDKYLSSIKQLLKFIKSFIDIGEKICFFTTEEIFLRASIVIVWLGVIM